MTATALTNASVLINDGFQEGISVLIEDGLITGVSRTVPNGFIVRDYAGLYLVPGFIDIQVNGGGGLLFNDNPSLETIERMARAHRRFGTTGMLPTLISDDLDKVAQAIQAIDNAIEAGVPGILGIHLEGPFLAPARKGAHRADKLRMLEDAHLPILLSGRHGVTHITLAPECVEPAQIRHLVSRGAKVSLGHSDASFVQAQAIEQAGATGFTHLFNAMSQFTGREPGMVGAAFASRTAFSGIIADGEHVHPASLMAAFDLVGPDRLMLVTDAMSLADSELTSFPLQGQTIHRSGNALRNDNGTLAGSALTMIEALRGMMTLTGVCLADACRMAATTPARFLDLGNQVGRIEKGLRADLVLLDENLKVVGTMIAGDLN